MTELTTTLWSPMCPHYKSPEPHHFLVVHDTRSNGELPDVFDEKKWWTVPYSFGLSHYYGGGGCPGELDKYVTGRRNNGSEYDVRVTEKTYVSNQWTHAALMIENDVITFFENGLPIGSTFRE